MTKNIFILIKVNWRDGHMDDGLTDPQMDATSYRNTRFLGIKVRWKKKQHHIGDFLMLVVPISNTLG